MKWQAVLPLLGLGLLGLTEPVQAHGANIEYRDRTAVEVRASFDTGEPMANAQVTVYAPDDPSQPWQTGTTDEAGRYVFVPESDLSGDWTVRVRQAGHGDIVTISRDETAQSSESEDWSSSVVASAGETNVPQRVVTVAAVVWGCIGTAFYFSRPKNS